MCLVGQGSHVNILAIAISPARKECHCAAIASHNKPEPQIRPVREFPTRWSLSRTTATVRIFQVFRLVVSSADESQRQQSKH
jgi:hypothetical protein